MALDVLVTIRVLAVARAAHVAAEGQPGALKVAPQAHVERDVAIVRVHVEAEVLALLVLHDELP